MNWPVSRGPELHLDMQCLVSTMLWHRCYSFSESTCRFSWRNFIAWAASLVFGTWMTLIWKLLRLPSWHLRSCKLDHTPGQNQDGDVSGPTTSLIRYASWPWPIRTVPVQASGRTVGSVSSLRLPLDCSYWNGLWGKEVGCKIHLRA